MLQSSVPAPTRTIDLLETFNRLVGLSVRHVIEEDVDRPMLDTKVA